MPLFKNPFKKSKGGNGADKATKTASSPTAKGGPRDFGSNDLLNKELPKQADDISLLDDVTEEKAKKSSGSKKGLSPEEKAQRNAMVLESLVASGLMEDPKAKEARRARKAAPLDVVKDKHVKSKEKVGAGSENEVTKIKTTNDIGKSGKKTGFFKKDSKNGQTIGKESGIGTKKGDAHMAARSVASSRLDQALGIDVLSEEKFGKVGGKKGVVSALADGKQLAKTAWSEVSKSDYTEAYAPMGDAWAKKEGDKYYKFDGSSTADVDLSRPETQKGFSDLAVMDYLSGQVDRHAGNVFVDEKSGKVTGIDNDLAFGNKDYETNRGKSGLSEMPDLIDSGTADKLLKMTPQEFEATLKGKKGDYGKLSQDEIDEAKKRFAMMQAKCAIMKKSGGLVDTWDDSTFAKSEAKADDISKITLQTAQGNDYLARAINAQKSSAAKH